MKKIRKCILFLLLIVILISAIGMSIPVVRESVLWHVNKWWVRAFYIINPPEEAVFVPQDELASAVQQTLSAATKTAQAEPTLTPTEQELEVVVTPTRTPTPLPDRVNIEGIENVSQHGYWNFCAPANLYMGLSFWHWDGDMVSMGDSLKPYDKDKNVMAYEMEDFVRENTDLNVTLRHGGTPELVKKLVANGYPVIIELGTFRIRDIDGHYSWMGHYDVISGYDDTKDVFIVQDSYFEPGVNYEIPYETLIKEWRSFDFLFMVIYPPEREESIFSILGDYVDLENSDRIALQIATDEANSLTGVDQFFAWFNKGTSMVRLYDYYGAASAYDQAFYLYSELEKEQRPWRMMWYQTGPYFAYYYTYRYQDVIDLATQTIDNASQPYLEESYYWRAQAEIALGELDNALEDLRQSLEYHPDFPPSVQALQDLGYSE